MKIDFIGLIIVFLIVLQLDLFGAGGSISGQALDSQTGNPLISASVALHKSADSSLVTGLYTKENGKFIFDNLAYGKYYIKVSYVGYGDGLSNELVLTPANTDINSGNIKLVPEYVNTSELNVTARKEFVEYNFDKKVINVERSMVAAGGSATDVLRNTPSVAVDVDGNVSLRGSGSIQILIDGKPSSRAQSGSTMLDMIPAESIDKIEIITNPSARYEAEGSTGIINIVMKKEKALGTNGIFTVNAGTGDKYGANANINTGLGGVNLYFNYSLRDDRRSGSGLSSRVLYSGDTTTTLLSNSSRSTDMLSHQINPGFEFNFWDNNQISFNANYNYSDRTHYNNVNYNQSENYQASPLLYFNNIAEPNFDNSLDLNLSYRHTFEKPGHQLNASAMYSYSRDNESTNSYLFYQDNLEYSPRNWITKTKENVSTATFQFDYSLPLEYGIKVETGYKTNFRNFDNSFNYLNADLLKGGTYEDISKKNNFLFEENVHSIYGIIQDSLADFRIQGGLRYEYTIIGGDQLITGEKFDRSYGSLFPSIHLSYTLTDINKAFLSYSRRINRPRSHSLDPIIDYSDSLNLWHGNPNLKPEYIDAIEFGMENNFSFAGINYTLFYRRTTDMMTMFQLSLGNNVFEITRMNIAKGINYGMEFSVFKPVSNWLRFNGDFSFFKNIISGATPDMVIDNESFNWTARINTNINFSQDLSFQVMANYSSPSATAQGTRAESYNIDLGAKLDLFDKKLQVFSRLSDIFNTQSHKFRNNGVDFISISEFRRESRVLVIGLTYKLNGNGMSDKKKDRQQPMQDDFME
jgi:outer membrane receptor protein involved in Fe transport